MPTILYFYLIIFIPSCEKSSFHESSKAWAKTTATITAVETMHDKYAYTIEYPTSESTAINKEGKPISGPISQYGVVPKKPLLNQEIPAQYLKEEPIIFKLLKPMQYES